MEFPHIEFDLIKIVPQPDGYRFFYKAHVAEELDQCNVSFEMNVLLSPEPGQDFSQFVREAKHEALNTIALAVGQLPRAME